MNGNPIEPPSGSEDFSHAFHVPDDARELDRDVEAWRREERWARRRQRLERLAFLAIPLPRRWRQRHGQRDKRGVAVPVIALIVVAVGLFSATATLVTTRATPPTRPPVPLKLATPTATPGAVGGLLPDATLTTATGATSARDLRPGVVGIVTPGCDCGPAVDALARRAATSALPLYLVGSPAQRADLDKLLAVSPPNVHALIDTNGAFAAAYAPVGLTVVPVHADGVTTAAIRDFTPQTSLGPVLASLKEAGPP